MGGSKDYNDPNRLPQQKNGGVTSIRLSKIVSIAPEEMDPSKVYLGQRPVGEEASPDGNQPD